MTSRDLKRILYPASYKSIVGILAVMLIIDMYHWYQDAPFQMEIRAFLLILTAILFINVVIELNRKYRNLKSSCSCLKIR